MKKPFIGKNAATDIDRQAFASSVPVRIVRLPTYTFEHRQYKIAHPLRAPVASKEADEKIEDLLYAIDQRIAAPQR